MCPLQTLEMAASGAEPHPAAMRTLAQYLLEPGRVACKGELSLSATLAQGNSQFQRDTVRARQLLYTAASLGDSCVSAASSRVFHTPRLCDHVHCAPLRVAGTP